MKDNDGATSVPAIVSEIVRQADQQVVEQVALAVGKTALSASDAPTSSQAMDLAAQQLLNLQLPSVSSLDQVPGLQGQVSTLQQLAGMWQKTLSSQVLTTKNQVVSFGTQFSGTYTTLTSLVPQVSAGDTEAISQFTMCLSTTSDQLTSVRSQVETLNAALNSYREQLQTSDQNIGSLTGPINSEINRLESNLDSYSNTINDDDQMIAQAESSGDEDALRFYSAEKKRLEDYIPTVQHDRDALNTSLTLLPSLGTSTGQLVTGASQLSQQWQTMGATLNDVNTNLNTGSAFLNAQLQQLRDEVTDAINVANQL